MDTPFGDRGAVRGARRSRFRRRAAPPEIAAAGSAGSSRWSGGTRGATRAFSAAGYNVAEHRRLRARTAIRARSAHRPGKDRRTAGARRSDRREYSSALRRNGNTATRSSPKPKRTKPSRAEAGDLVSVTIGTIPYGEVFVDGKRVGAAPVVVKLAPGRHRIMARSQQLRRVETIVVTPEMNHVVLDLRNDKASP